MSKDRLTGLGRMPIVMAAVSLSLSLSLSGISSALSPTALPLIWRGGRDQVAATLCLRKNMARLAIFNHVSTYDMTS